MTIDPGMEKPFGVPADFGDYFRLMTDMLFIAFQADLTRVATVMVGREGSNRPYPEIGIPDSHHPITHHQMNPVLLDKISAINTYHVKLFAAFLRKLKDRKEGDSNLLDNSMICYGSGLSDGDQHLHDELPTILAGRGGKFFTPGRHIIYQRETPVTNLFATMAQRMGVRADHIGDSTGQLAGLSLSQGCYAVPRTPASYGCGLQHDAEPARRRADAGLFVRVGGKARVAGGVDRGN
jgi:hypothetical protein